MPVELRGAQVLKDLDVEDTRILQMIETLLKESEYAPFNRIVKYSGYLEKDVAIRLSKLHKLKLIERWKKHYVGYKLKFAGFDALALNALYNKKLVSSVGMSKGVGKESDVFYALDFDDNEIIMKINRTGRMSFKNVKRKRDFIKNRRHYSIFFIAAVASQREYSILKQLQNSKLAIPKIIGYNRHIITMNIIDGIELVNVSYLENPTKILKQITKFAKELYKKHKLVHADLTEYNVLFNPDNGKITIIDFPQAIPTDHPEAFNYLKRDFEHLIDFFSKKHGLGAEIDTILDYITK